MMLRDKGTSLGTVTQLLRELAGLRRAFPKLTGVMSQRDGSSAPAGNAVVLEWLDLERELDFSLTVMLGELPALACTSKAMGFPMHASIGQNARILLHRQACKPGSKPVSDSSLLGSFSYNHQRWQSLTWQSSAGLIAGICS